VCAPAGAAGPTTVYASNSKGESACVWVSRLQLGLAGRRGQVRFYSGRHSRMLTWCRAPSHYRRRYSGLQHRAIWLRTDSVGPLASLLNTPRQYPSLRFALSQDCSVVCHVEPRDESAGASRIMGVGTVSIRQVLDIPWGVCLAHPA